MRSSRFNRRWLLNVFFGVCFFGVILFHLASWGSGSHPELATRRGFCVKIDTEIPASKFSDCDVLFTFYFRNEDDQLKVCTTRAQLKLLGYREVGQVENVLGREIIVIFHPPSDTTQVGALNHLADIQVID